MKSACIGTCDCCVENVEVCQCWVHGIETWACDVCRGVEPKRPRAQAVEPMALITLVLVLAIIAVPVIVAVTQMPPRLAVHSMWGGAR
jgi:hypothetical protein